MTLLAVLAAVFVPQANEKWYDLGGSLGFLSTTFVSLYYSTLKARYWHATDVSFLPLSSLAPRQLLLTTALTVWTVRLGSFLVQVITTSRFCSVRCDPCGTDHFPCSAPSRSEETHVSTKSSINLGHFWRFGWHRVCLLIQFLYASHTPAASWVLLTGLPVYLVRFVARVCFWYEECFSRTGECSPLTTSPRIIHPGLRCSRFICQRSSRRDHR
jgi:hypothetical protein